VQYCTWEEGQSREWGGYCTAQAGGSTAAAARRRPAAAAISERVLCAQRDAAILEALLQRTERARRDLLGRRRAAAALAAALAAAAAAAAAAALALRLCGRRLSDDLTVRPVGVGLGGRARPWQRLSTLGPAPPLAPAAVPGHSPPARLPRRRNTTRPHLEQLAALEGAHHPHRAVPRLHLHLALRQRRTQLLRNAHVRRRRGLVRGRGGRDGAGIARGGKRRPALSRCAGPPTSPAAAVSTPTTTPTTPAPTCSTMPASAVAAFLSGAHVAVSRTTSDPLSERTCAAGGGTAGGGSDGEGSGGGTEGCRRAAAARVLQLGCWRPPRMALPAAPAGSRSPAPRCARRRRAAAPRCPRTPPARRGGVEHGKRRGTRRRSGALCACTPFARPLPSKPTPNPQPPTPTHPQLPPPPTSTCSRGSHCAVTTWMRSHTCRGGLRGGVKCWPAAGGRRGGERQHGRPSRRCRRRRPTPPHHVGVHDPAAGAGVGAGARVARCAALPRRRGRRGGRAAAALGRGWRARGGGAMDHHPALLRRSGRHQAAWPRPPRQCRRCGRHCRDGPASEIAVGCGGGGVGC
jgi:hypothetical protein